ncbi:quinolinate synthase NadA [Listeria ivanovii]|uniref:Quinolinate synthase n=2 Tax=Listeria ivanovii TaxID=1638 RepID=A0ABS1G8C8_LISIV|nr:quinolinate synthase NadA [Listeria ivanovii]EFR96310.1 quinolinate synthetase complex, A subunit [Listeria ivanovii FSL F6-596]AIS60427.1 quinolinate synthetase [Listeria ivanovii subsp. londoniensis]AIS63252.1 quinolinate synthetase [Listeria ivanovii subsp. londoniensis]MBC2255954.1 quinolinate synthase NadA [Listeria ivanovii]MBK1963128.1 quinolinate synthase NadA [Listeria ivanovii subsp. londoniensis]
MNLLETVENDTMPARYKLMSKEIMTERVFEIKQQLGQDLFIPCHHYQKDEVVPFADAIGDSLQLAQIAANNKQARNIVFCGVHFMAETADMLTTKEQIVTLPDMRAGCSMADMADIHQLTNAWTKLQELFDDTILPVTYINSTAAIKSFVGEHGGTTVTSSNATKIVAWALEQKERIFFLPDQHLGRNTAFELGIPLDAMAIWDPIKNELDYEGHLANCKVILWKGYCSVHQHFTVKNIENIRKSSPNMRIIVHPECTHEVVSLADDSGSTKKIVTEINNAAAGTEWAIGTEANLVARIIQENPDKKIVSLNPFMCPCMTMNRIDLSHLLWTLEAIQNGEKRNQIKVDEQTTKFALKALERMLQLS